ncbi:hypothetical protein ACFS5J_09595 [Flavobacterium chuncheonense]|uniref:Uncharacterized protein n=1 Tax=Flavobacterium chuncheonense TaxID=2026653 RepID=A0ABW5YML0_9FLAO
MKLTTAQIDRLYEFTRQHYVEWYDLQTELVDHLANAIEAQWQENPKLDFEAALNNEFKKFGVFGFMDVVEKRQVALNKRYNKIVWKHFKAFFTIPKVVATVSTIGVLFVTFRNLGKGANLLVYILLLAAILLFWILITFKRVRYNKAAKTSGKKWLFKEIIFGYGNFAGLSYLPIQLIVHFDIKSEMGIFKALFFSILIVSMCLLDYIVLYEIPKKAEEYLKETYPEYDYV